MRTIRATLEAGLMVISFVAAVGCGKTTKPAETTTTKQTTPVKAPNQDAAKRVLFSDRAAAEAAFSLILGAKFSPMAENPEIRLAKLPNVDEAMSWDCSTWGVGESIERVIISVGSDATSRNARKSQQMALDICDLIEGEMDTMAHRTGVPVSEPQSLRKWLTVVAMPGLALMSKTMAELPTGARETRITVTLFKKNDIHVECFTPPLSETYWFVITRKTDRATAVLGKRTTGVARHTGSVD